MFIGSAQSESFVAMRRISRQRGKEEAMCIVHMRVQCSDTFSEVLVGDVVDTELTIESIVGTALLEVFDTVLVENVTVHHSPERNVEDGERGQRLVRKRQRITGERCIQHLSPRFPCASCKAHTGLLPGPFL